MSTVDLEDTTTSGAHRPRWQLAVTGLCGVLLAWCLLLDAVMVYRHRWVDLAVVATGTALVALATLELRRPRLGGGR